MVLAEIGGELVAFSNDCPHVGLTMEDAEIDDGEITCPFHGSCFELKTGVVTNGPAREALPVYEVKVDGDDVQVRI
ncbi:MAG: Rieske (2Fe-2S) protein [SAR202 cluster bacterium]|nr:Rieske (2Fe-2S) protein [SAR202 cluster bacterium]